MSASSFTLRAFLESRRVTDDSWNITGIPPWSGKFYVRPEDYNEFLDIHSDVSDETPVHLLEKHHSTVSPILIDLDFRYEDSTDLTRRYNDDQVLQFVHKYATTLQRFIDIPYDIRFFIFETPSPTTEKDKLKDGIHIICPDLVVEYDVPFTLRKYLLEQNIIQEYFPDIINPAEDCFDLSVIQRNNWFVYGSSKPNREPYEVTKCYILNKDGIINEHFWEESDRALVSLFSLGLQTTKSTYSLRPEHKEEWNTWRSIGKESVPKPINANPITDVIIHQDDAESVISHLSDNISNLLQQPGIVWTVHQDEDNEYKITHNSYKCLVEKGYTHTDLNHSCIYVTKTHSTMNCLRHKSRKIPKTIAISLWNMLQTHFHNALTDVDPIEERYQELKAEFEKTTFRILNPPGYMVCVNSEWVRYNRHQLVDMNSGLFLDEHKKERFIDHLLRDDTMRTYASMGCYIDRSECLPNVFNTFQGFTAESLPNGIIGDISPILDHFMILCNHNTGAFEFFLDWLAFVVQHPGKLNGIAIVLMGNHGCGKDILMTWFGKKIIGEKYYRSSSRPQYDLFSGFNSSRKDVVFYHLQECNSTAIQQSHVEQMKNYITDPVATLQIKNVNTSSETTVKNYNHFVMTTNSKAPFFIERTERRFVALRPSPEKCGNNDYFQHLLQCLEDETVIRGFYDFLASRNIEGRDWLIPPITDALIAWKSEFMNPLDQFVDYFKLTNETPCSIQAAQLYTKYIEWCESANEDVLPNKIFGEQMRGVNSVSKQRKTGGTFYTFL